MAEADDSSVTVRPVRWSRTTSLSPAHQRAPVRSARSSWPNHSSLVIGLIGCTGVPDDRCRATAWPDERSPRAWSAARASAQVSSGVSAAPASSSATRPCMAVLTDTATTVAPERCTAATASASAPSTAASTAADVLHRVARRGLQQRVAPLGDVLPGRAQVDRDGLGRRRPHVEAEHDLGAGDRRRDLRGRGLVVTGSGRRQRRPSAHRARPGPRGGGQGRPGDARASSGPRPGGSGYGPPAPAPGRLVVVLGVPVSARARATSSVVGVVAVLALAGCSTPAEPERDEAGAVVATEEAADVFSLAVGDCTNDSGETEGEVTTVEAVPCDGPHDNEAYHAEDLPDGDYPGDDAVFTSADEICLREFEPFVGLSYEESRLAYFPYTPTQDSWEQGGDREVLCLVYDTAGEPLTGTAAGLGE